MIIICEWCNSSDTVSYPIFTNDYWQLKKGGPLWYCKACAVNSKAFIEQDKPKLKCSACKGTGVFIARLDNTSDFGIQRCDHCKLLSSDRDAIKIVQNIIYGEVHGK